MMHRRGPPAEDAGYRRGGASDRNRNNTDGSSRSLSIAERLGNGAGPSGPNSYARDSMPEQAPAVASVPQLNSMADPAVPALVGAAAVVQTPPIDREKTCPLLLRAFPKIGGHHRLEEFGGRVNLPSSEVQVYTWMDATLRELSDMIKEVQPAARTKASCLSFQFVYPDKRGHNVMRQVGRVHATRGHPDDEKTLKQLNFQTGDYLDVAIFP